MLFRTLVRLIGGALLVAVLALLYACLIEPRWVQVERVEKRVRALPPAFAGLRIAFVSDAHYGRFFHDSDVARLESLLRAEAPDVILIGGDLTEESDYGRKALLACARIGAPLGVIGIAGNHEYAMVRREAGNANEIAYLRAMYEGTGATLLIDDSLRLTRGGQSIDILGGDYYIQTSELASLVDRAPDACRILLAHTPETLDRWIDAGRDPAAFALSLAGHTHGGQVTALGLWAPIKVAHGTDIVRSGWKSFGGTPHLTSNGFGMTGLPIRFCARPQIHIITLRAKEDAAT